MAKLWGKAPSEYAGADPGSLEAYLLDAGIAFRMNAEDAKDAAESKLQGPAGLPTKMGTDHDPDAA